MAWALVAETVKQSVDANTVTSDAINSTGADTLFVFIPTISPSSPGIGITDSYGNTWVRDLIVSPTNRTAQIFRCTNPIVGAGHTVTVTGGAGLYPALHFLAFSGAWVLSSPLDKTNYGFVEGFNTFHTGSVTPSSTNELVITGVATLGTPTISAGFTLLSSLPYTGYSSGIGVAYQFQTAIASVDPIWTVDAGNSAGIILTYRIAPVTYSKTLSAAQGQLATLAPQFISGKILTATQGQTATLARQFITGKPLVATQGQIATLTKIALAGRVLTATQGQVATLKKSLTHTLIATQGQQAFLSITAQHSPYFLQVTVNGVTVTSSIKMSSLRIDDELNEAPNLCYFTWEGRTTVPSPGQIVSIYQGNSTPSNILFGGVITDVKQTREGSNIANVSWEVTCQDYTYILNRQRPIWQYNSVSISTIVADLTSRFTLGVITASGVQGGLIVASITFDGSQTFAECLTALAQLAGAYWYVDYFGIIHFFITESNSPGAFDQQAFDQNAFYVTGSVIVNPNPINVNNATDVNGARQLTTTTDDSQLRNRIFIQGNGSSVNLDGSTALLTNAFGGLVPVSDQTPFSSGLVKFPAQVASYSGVSTSPSKSAAIVVGSIQNPASVITPSGAAVISPIGSQGPSGNIGIGGYRYAASTIDDKGNQSSIGPLSGLVTISAITPPSISMSASQVAGTLGVVSTPIQAYNYWVSFFTSNGETLPVQMGSIAISQAAAPPSSGNAAYVQTPGNLRVGSYFYATSFLLADGGETTATGGGAAFIPAITTPYHNGASFQFFNPPVIPNQNGNIYDYYTSAIDATGETFITFIGSISIPATFAGNQVGIQINIGATVDARITGIRVYHNGRNPNTGFQTGINLIGEHQGTSSFSVFDGLLSIGVPPGGIAGKGTGQVQLSSIPISSDDRVVGRSIYRSTSGAFGTFFRIATLNNNTATAFTDNVQNPDGAQPRNVSTLGTAKVLLSGIPKSGDPRVIGRNIYRSTQLLSNRRLLITSLGDNTTTTCFDNNPDEFGSQTPVLVDTTNNGLILLTIPGVPSNITKIQLFRTRANGSSVFALGAVDAGTSTFLDNVNDSNLGSAPAATFLSNLPIPKSSTTLNFTYTKDSLGIYSAAFENTGWVKVGGQLIYYTSISNTFPSGVFNGIPSSGLGSIITDISQGDQVVGVPFLKGVSSLTFGLGDGDSANIWAQRDDAASQATYGVFEFLISDSNLKTPAQLNARGDAELVMFKDPIISLDYITKDQNTFSGRVIVVNLPLPTGIIIPSAMIQKVIFSNFLPTTLPDRQVHASSSQFSLQDILRRLTLS